MAVNGYSMKIFENVFEPFSDAMQLTQKLKHPIFILAEITNIDN